ncbi:MAG TPA: pyridoxal phosphate-dependent aminotransferase, partial [Chitinophagaceae bacterium]|nr:pyridoxal phosphate-dependent aminotransferase [Chitinophagaceae bacterium]
KIEKSSDISQFLLEEAHLAIVPFSAFGADRESDWFRLSVGTCSIQAIPAMLSTLKSALQKLQ